MPRSFWPRMGGVLPRPASRTLGKPSAQHSAATYDSEDTAGDHAAFRTALGLWSRPLVTHVRHASVYTARGYREWCLVVLHFAKAPTVPSCRILEWETANPDRGKLVRGAKRLLEPAEKGGSSDGCWNGGDGLSGWWQEWRRVTTPCWTTTCCRRRSGPDFRHARQSDSRSPRALE